MRREILRTRWLLPAANRARQWRSTVPQITTRPRAWCISSILSITAGRKTPYDGDNNSDEFGRSCAIAGYNYTDFAIVVGAPGANAYYHGAVQSAAISLTKVDGPVASTRYGASVGVTGNSVNYVVAVGAQNEDSGAGAFYVSQYMYVGTVNQRSSENIRCSPSDSPTALGSQLAVIGGLGEVSLVVLAPGATGSAGCTLGTARRM